MEKNRGDWWMRGKICIITQLIKNRFEKNIKLCDVGAGAGLMLESLRHEGYNYLTATDSFGESLELLNKKGFNPIQTHLPDFHTGKKFDVLLLLDVLEHIDNDDETIYNLKESLNDDGHCIITVPAFQFLWTKKDEDLMHKRRYTKRNLKKLIQKHGFKIEFITYYNFFLFPLAIMYSILNKKKTSIGRYGFWQNKILYPIFLSEALFLNRGIRFPFGVSLLAIIRKPK